MSGSKVLWAGVGLLLVLIFLVYFPVLDFGFVRWDDNVHVYQNPHFPPQSLSDFTVFWTAPYVQVYVPVDFTIWGLLSTFAWTATPRPAATLDYTTLLPGPFHLLNLVAHMGITVMVFVLFRRLKINPHASLFGAALFALHPIQVESVAWVTGFKEVSSTFFGVAALLFQSLAIDSNNERTGPLSRRFIACTAAGTISYLFALLSLPSAVGFALAALLIWSRRRGKWAVASLYAPLFWILISLGVIWYNKTANLLDPDMLVPSLSSRFAVAGDAILFYAGKFIWPFNFGIDYGHSPDWVLGQPNSVWLAALPVFSFMGLAYLWSREYRAAIPVGLIFFGLLPTMGFVPFVYQMYSTVADRYAYGAVIGLGCAGGVLLDCMARHGRLPRIAATTGAVGIVLFLGYQSTVQTVYWRDSRSLFEHAIEINQNSWAQRNNLALLLMDAGANEAAEQQLEKVLVLKPRYAQAWLNLGSVSLRLQHYSKAKTCFEKVIEYRPQISDGYYNLAIIYYGVGNKAKAAELLHQALERQPGWLMALDLLAKVQRLPDS